MKKIVLFLVVLIFFSGCDDENFNNNNPYIPNYSFSIPFNLDLPLYSSLKFPGEGILYDGQNAGSIGIIIFNTGSGFNAFDAACPNQQISSCSRLILQEPNVVCPCDEESYSLFTGLGNLEYPLKRYRVEVINESNIRVYN
ncbi:Rieske (2Fe-2S) protein [Flavobacterium sp.]|uniref:Rieske (2Fe-2S) protein n=1 Tax=Flavobacterium sp. TaxID=239 RepID=UPI003527913D